MKKFLLEAYGWYGAGAILLAYALVSFDYLSAQSFWYQFLNGTGALGIAVISLYEKSWQPGVLNIVWTLIAVVALAQILL